MILPMNVLRKLPCGSDLRHWSGKISLLRRSKRPKMSQIRARCRRVKKKHGLHRVEPVVFTLGSKEDLATTLFQVMSEKRLKLRRDDKPLHTALASIKRIITSAGNVRYDAPHTEAGHGDEAWALALAVHAATQPIGRRHVQPERRF
jgi:phage FluMu gp28-like protein